MREVVAGETVCGKNAQSFPIDHITNWKKPSLIQRHVRGRGEGGVLHLPGAAPRRQDPQEGVQGDARKGGKFGGFADSCIPVRYSNIGDSSSSISAQTLPGQDATCMQKHIFRCYDENENGYIDFVEFMVALQHTAQQKHDFHIF